MRNYFKNILSAIATILGGMRITFSHLRGSYRSVKTSNIMSADYFSGQRGLASVPFPHNKIPVPEIGRYQLDCEIEDCIVCDQCAKVCPVDCIDIEGIRSPTEIGRTSDDRPLRIHAARFDIDMAKCCFCGLCTTVCPTECLVMTPTYEFSTYDLREHVFAYAKMSENEIEEKKKVWADFQATKNAPKPPAT